MNILRKGEAKVITANHILLKIPDGEIVTDGQFIWVNYKGTCILRLKFQSVKVDLVDVKTHFKYGFIDGIVTPETNEERKNLK